MPGQLRDHGRVLSLRPCCRDPTLARVPEPHGGDVPVVRIRYPQDALRLLHRVPPAGLVARAVPGLAFPAPLRPREDRKRFPDGKAQAVVRLALPCPRPGRGGSFMAVSSPSATG